jgi:hypothetical protein
VENITHIYPSSKGRKPHHQRIDLEVAKYVTEFLKKTWSLRPQHPEIWVNGKYVPCNQIWHPLIMSPLM